jgi:hypothetical protein
MLVVIFGWIPLASVADKAIICRGGDGHGLREGKRHKAERDRIRPVEASVTDEVRGRSVEVSGGGSHTKTEERRQSTDRRRVGCVWWWCCL